MRYGTVAAGGGFAIATTPAPAPGEPGPRVALDPVPAPKRAPARRATGCAGRVPGLGPELGP